MFIGEYKHNIDVKGRLAIPAKFRQKIDKGAIITKGFDDCLYLYTKEEWETLALKVAAMPINKANNRAYARFMLASAMDVDLDAQGRINLPDYLRQYAGLGKRVVVAGLYNRLEVWDEAKWEKYKQSVDTKSGDIAEALGELGV